MTYQQYLVRTSMAALLFAALSAAIVFAQEVTPTLGPTKTPDPNATFELIAVTTTPVPVTVEATVQIDAEATSSAPLTTANAVPLAEPLTQADLSVLTGNVQRPNGIAFFEDDLFISCSGDFTIYRTNSRTGQTRTYIGNVGNAHTMYVEEVNNATTLWVPDFLNQRFMRVTPNGAQMVAGDLRGPWGVVYEDENHFLVSNLLGDTVQRINRDGEVETLLDEMAAPAGLAMTADALFVANNGSTRRAIEWYPRDTLGQGEAQPLVTGLQNTTGLQLAGDGMLYFAYALGTRGVVGRVDPNACMANGGCTNEQVEIVVYTELATPIAGLTVTPDMRLFLHTMFSPDVYWAQLGDPPATE